MIKVTFEVSNTDFESVLEGLLDYSLVMIDKLQEDKEKKELVHDTINNLLEELSTMYE